MSTSQFILISSLVLLSPVWAHGLISQIIMVQGHLVKSDDKTATIKDDKGLMIVPIESIDTSHVSAGQWIQVSVDVVKFYRLNPKKFEIAPSPSKKPDL